MWNNSHKSKLKAIFRPVYHKVTGVPAVMRWATRAANGSRFRSWIARNPCLHVPDRTLLYQHLFDTQGLAGPIEYLEFGVWKGGSIKWWVEKNTHPESSFTGFDSFEGLPTDWEGERARKGAYSAEGKVPEIADPRCRFVRGWFHESLFPWLGERKSFDRRLVVNLDADLYGSTLFVLLHLMPRLKRGDILIFDEFHSYNHEFRAWEDALTAHPLKYRALARSGQFTGWDQLALEIL